MMGFIKRMFGERPRNPEPAPVPSPAASRPAVLPDPAPAPVATLRTPPPPMTGPTFGIPLESIADSLPPELASALQSRMGNIKLSQETVLSQLASGQVCISFRELFQGAPPGTFDIKTASLETKITLPLAQILARIPPELWKKRPGKSIVELPPDIGDLFGPKGAASPRKPAEVSASRPSPVASAPVSSPPPARREPVPVPPAASPAPTAALAPIPVAAPPPPPPPAETIKTTLPSLQELAASSSAAPGIAATERVLAVPLAQLCGDWPEAVRQEIGSQNLTGRMVRLRLDKVETGLRAGQISFTWSEVAASLSPAAGPVPSALGETTLILPLAVLAPLFLAQRRPSTTPRRRAVALEGIPDLFSSRKPAPVEPPPPPPPVMPALTLAPEVSAPAQAVPAAPAVRRDPRDFVKDAARLPGVTGALIASEDGLLVAAQLPAELSADKLAAFLPSIFGKIRQMGLDLSAGELLEARFDFQGNPWLLARGGSLFFVVLGSANRPLPEEQLRSLRAELTQLSS